SKLFSNISTKIENKICLDLDFMVDQYEKSYFSYERSAKNIKEIRWNTKNGYEPENIREFYGLTNNNPIKNAAYLNKRKFIKFDFTLDGVIKYNNSEVYVIHFLSSRNHSNFTKRVYLSQFSGTMYIDKKDYAIVKIIEHWDITDFPEEHRQGLNLKGNLSKFIQKEYTTETIETNFKKVQNHYFISNSKVTISGNLINTENEKLQFSTTIQANWYDFEVINPKKINFKEEQHLFHSVKYNEQFWNNYVFPNRNID
ncbi:MAG: hypothetical protein Q8K02_11060, partial [Flavobacterium sp.]|nr:hypothetical protein [Flavobacterium sp.]